MKFSQESGERQQHCFIKLLLKRVGEQNLNLVANGRFLI